MAVVAAMVIAAHVRAVVAMAVVAVVAPVGGVLVAADAPAAVAATAGSVAYSLRLRQASAMDSAPAGTLFVAFLIFRLVCYARRGEGSGAERR